MRLNQENSALRICVDSFTNGQIAGKVYGQRLEKPLIFADIGSLLLQIEDVLNAQDYPRAFQRKRSFLKDENISDLPPNKVSGDFMSKDAVASNSGEIATFIVMIITRQNTSWQGMINWLDENPHQHFQSALEFIRIVNDKIMKKQTQNVKI